MCRPIIGLKGMDVPATSHGYEPSEFMDE